MLLVAHVTCDMSHVCVCVVVVVPDVFVSASDDVFVLCVAFHIYLSFAWFSLIDC